MRTAIEQYREPIALALRRFSLGLALGVLATALVVALTHPDLANSVVIVENRIQHQAGVQIAIAGIYLEESGLPMPVPSEVSVGYLGQRLTGNPLALFASWLGLTVLIVLGSTNLFLVSRRFGHRFLTSRIGSALHLTPSRVARAQASLGRWGPIAIVISRYVPGLRWAMAVACGVLGVRYRTFWFSTAISAAVWAAVMLTLGVTVGDAIGQAIMAHAWIGLLLPLPAATVLAAGLVRLVVRRRAATSVLAS